MADSPVDMTKVRRAAIAAGILVLLIIIVIFAARCSTPSTVVTAAAPSAPVQQTAGIAASTNVVAVAEKTYNNWAGTGQWELDEIRWFDAQSAFVLATLRTGERVGVTLYDGGQGWQAGWHPTPVSADNPDPVIEPLPELSNTAGDDQRWQTTVGFLREWLTGGGDLWRWTTAGYAPDPPAVLYTNWEVTGLGAPTFLPGVPGAQVFPVDVRASTDGVTTRPYRFYVVLLPDAEGQWGVVDVGYRPVVLPTIQPAETPAATS